MAINGPTCMLRKSVTEDWIIANHIEKKFILVTMWCGC